MSQRKLYRGQQINVSFDGRRCIHAAHCTRRLPAVFDTEQRPWIQVDQAAADEVAATVNACPSGALRLETRDGPSLLPAPAANIVILAGDGPLYVRGQLKVSDAAGEIICEDDRIALCRCGASANKPFCDNSHQRISFRDQLRLVDNRDQVPAQTPAGELQIICRANGAYLLRGHFEIHTEDGSVRFRGQRAALCRCGGSGNMPFCDSSHRRLGFDDSAAAVGVEAAE